MTVCTAPHAPLRVPGASRMCRFSAPAPHACLASLSVSTGKCADIIQPLDMLIYSFTFDFGFFVRAGWLIRPTFELPPKAVPYPSPSCTWIPWCMLPTSIHCSYSHSPTLAAARAHRISSRARQRMLFHCSHYVAIVEHPK
jgi:hypothetical protein